MSKYLLFFSILALFLSSTMRAEEERSLEFDAEHNCPSFSVSEASLEMCRKITCPCKCKPEVGCEWDKIYRRCDLLQ